MIHRIMILVILVVASPTFAEDKSASLQQFQGKWEVDKLVENGKVIPKQAIKEWLPSGGRAEIIENAIIFRSPHNGKKFAKIFSITPTKYPKGIEISTPKGKNTWGIYRFDEGRLIICLSDPDEARRPDEFSAETGSKRMLMVLKRRSTATKSVAKSPKSPSKPKQVGQTGKFLSDDKATKMLAGSWKLQDSAGSLYIAFNPNGTFSTVREYQELRLFHRSFVQTPISTGTWSIKNGALSAHVKTSVRLDRVNLIFSFNIRSISDRDMIFVDQLGRVSRAIKVH